MAERITPSLIISLLALIVSLGGVSYAAIQIPKNSVGTKQLKRNAVSPAKLKKNAVRTAKLKRGAVTAAKLQAGSVNSSKIQAGSVDSSKIRDGSLMGEDFAAGQLPGTTWQAARDADTLLDLTGTLSPVVSTAVLPAGAYLVFGRANIIGGAAISTLICSLEGDAAQNFKVAAGGGFPLSMASTAVLTEPRSIELRCSSSSGTPKIAQAHVIATQVTRVTGSG